MRSSSSPGYASGLAIGSAQTSSNCLVLAQHGQGRRGTPTLLCLTSSVRVGRCSANATAVPSAAANVQRTGQVAVRPSFGPRDDTAVANNHDSYGHRRPNATVPATEAPQPDRAVRDDEDLEKNYRRPG